MAIGRTWHPNPLSIRGQSALLISLRFRSGRAEHLQIRDGCAGPDCVPNAYETDVKFSVAVRFDSVREYADMKKCKHPERGDMERPSKCAR